MALIQRRKGGNYGYEFWHNGRRIYRSTKQRNKKIAQQCEAAHRARLARGEVGLVEITSAPPLKDFADRFKAHIKLRSAKNPETIRFYESKLERLLEFGPLSSALLSTIDEVLIESYVQHRRESVAVGTVNHELSTLSRMLHLAKSDKLISEVPKIDKLDGEHNREFVLSREQELIYLEACTPILRDVAILQLDTGMRIGEVCKLTWSNVKERHLTVKGGGKSKKDRDVRLTSRVKDMLAVRFAECNGNERVFPILETTLARQHQDVRESLGLDFWSTVDRDFVMHSFRHTFLTRLAQSGCSPYLMVSIAGWGKTSGLAMAMKYVHDDNIEQAFEQFERYASGNNVESRKNTAASAASAL